MVAPGTLIEGQYKVWEEISRFREEVLYAGQRLSDGAAVDIRVVSADAPRHRRKQFSDVASIVGRLDHPNCLSALGAGQLVDRTLYTVTEALNAGPLASLAGCSVPPRVLAEIALQLVAGLSHLHLQGILLGCVTPSGVTLGEHGGRPRLQIVDFSFARIAAGGGGPAPECRETRFLAPELGENVGERGEPTERSDLYSAGRVLQTLASPATPGELMHVFEALAQRNPDQRLSAADARRHLEAWIADDATTFDMSWLPDPEAAPISTGVFAVMNLDEVAAGNSSEILLAEPLPPPAPAAVPLAATPAPARSRWGLVVGLGGLALAGALAVVALRGGTPSAEATGPQAAAPASVAVATKPDAVAAPPAAAANTERAEVDAPEGNPIVWLAQVNRTDLGAVLPIRERTRLLDELESRRGVDERVNHRWNAMLDLWQAGDAQRPCATFAAALASLEGPPSGDVELDLLRRVVVPTPAAGSAAGVAPDDSCRGLQAAFDAFAGPRPKEKRTSRRRAARAQPRDPSTSEASSAAAPKPAAAAPKPKPSASVATKLDEDLRDF